MVMESVDVGTLGGVDNTWIQPNGTFRGVDYFDCDSDTFSKCVQGKKKGGHWNSLMGKNEFTSSIKKWISGNRGKNFMFRNTSDYTFIYAHKVI
jgi:hypothetical protein